MTREILEAVLVGTGIWFMIALAIALVLLAWWRHVNRIVESTRREQNRRRDDREPWDVS